MELGRKHRILLGLTPLLLVIDQWTKHIVLSRFSLGESIPVISGFFNFTYVRNTGAAFGIMAQASPEIRIPFFIIVPVIALGAIAYYFRRIPATSIKLSTAFAAVIGGALGNLVDRLRFGYVVDFIDFHWGYQHHFPAFNVADTLICVGVAVLVLDLLLQEDSVSDVSPAH